jgi:hypothetical protein
VIDIVSVWQHGKHSLLPGSGAVLNLSLPAYDTARYILTHLIKNRASHYHPSDSSTFFVSLASLVGCILPSRGSLAIYLSPSTSFIAMTHKHGNVASLLAGRGEVQNFPL